MTENPYGQNPPHPQSEGATLSSYHEAYGVPQPQATPQPQPSAAEATQSAPQPHHAQHAQQPTRPQGVPAPAPAPKAAPQGKPSSGKTFLLGFAGAAVACVLAFCQ